MTTGSGPGGEDPTGEPNDDLAGIRGFAAGQAAELDDFAAVLAQLRHAVGDPDVTIDVDAVWQRILARLDADDPRGGEA